MSSKPVCPYPQAFQDKAARIGWWGMWVPTPGVTYEEEAKEFYITLGDQHIYIMSIEEALSLSDDELVQRVETAIGMSSEEARERYGVEVEE